MDRRIAAILAVSCSCFTACVTDRHEPRTPIPHVTYEPASSPRPDLSSLGPVVTASGEEISFSEVLQEFVTRVAAQGDAETRFGALPLVSYEYRHPSPWVSELGLRIADEMSRRLDDAGYRGVVKTPRDLEVEMRAEHVRKADLVDLASVSELAKNLDLDVVAFGTLKLDNNVGRNGRDVLTLEITALDLVSNREIAHKRIEIPSDIARNRAFFELAGRESLWLATGT